MWTLWCHQVIFFQTLPEEIGTLNQNSKEIGLQSTRKASVVI
jgi:hypothetical protein